MILGFFFFFSVGLERNYNLDVSEISTKSIRSIFFPIKTFIFYKKVFIYLIIRSTKLEVRFPFRWLRPRPDVFTTMPTSAPTWPTTPSSATDQTSPSFGFTGRRTIAGWGSSMITRSVMFSSKILNNPQTQEVGMAGRNVLILIIP